MFKKNFFFFFGYLFRGGEIFCKFPDLTKSLLFHRHCLSMVFQTLHGFSLYSVQPVCIRFDDLDFIVRSQVVRNVKLRGKFTVDYL